MTEMDQNSSASSIKSKMLDDDYFSGDSGYSLVDQLGGLFGLPPEKLLEMKNDPAVQARTFFACIHSSLLPLCYPFFHYSVY